jgi:uncharacterized protein DUF6526
MKIQNYQNHSRYYTPHHFIFYPVVIALAAIAASQSFHDSEHALLWLMLACVFALFGVLSFMMRQHYSLGNQNRIVRLEMRLRYYILTQKRFEVIENKLSRSQIFALRFASDEELPALVERAVKENLSGDEIKKSVKNWLADEMRV